MKLTKKIILFISIMPMFIGCTNDLNTAKKKIEEEIFKRAHDPKSYEFIEMSGPDTIRKSDLLLPVIADSLELELMSMRLEGTKKTLDYYEQHFDKSDAGYVTIKDEFLRIKDELLRLKKNQSLYYEILNTDKDSIRSYTYTCHFRIRVPAGGFIKTKSFISHYPYEKDNEKWDDVVFYDGI